jgi:hypothetical protein
MDDGAHVAMYSGTLSSNTFLCTSYLRNSKVHATIFRIDLRKILGGLAEVGTKSCKTVRFDQGGACVHQLSAANRKNGRWIQAAGRLAAQCDHSESNCTEAGLDDAFKQQTGQYQPGAAIAADSGLGPQFQVAGGIRGQREPARFAAGSGAAAEFVIA